MAFTIVVKNLRCKIEEKLPTSVACRLYEELSYREANVFFSRYNKRGWNGINRLFDKKRQTFRTGHLNRVGRILQECGLSLSVRDERTIPPVAEPIDLSHVGLRDYQELAIDTALDRKSGLWLIATGGGKSRIICVTAGTLNLPTMIYVHTIDLLDQMKENVEELLGIEPGQIGDGVVDIRKFTVATMQSVSKALGVKKIDKGDSEVTDKTRLSAVQKKEIKDAVEGAAVVIVDEVHHATCKTLQLIMRNSKSARYRYGATATLREDKADLLIEGSFGKTLITKTASELIREQWLVPPTIYFHDVPYPNTDDPAVRRALEGNYHTKYKQFVVNNEERNAYACKAASQIISAGMKTLVLVQHIPHGEIIFHDLGIEHSIAFIQGRVRSRERKSILEEFRMGRIDGIVATSLADEGLDLPILDSAVLLGGGKSTVKAFQRVGRTLRLYSDADRVKKKAYVVEFHDKVKPLKSHSNRRLKLYKREPEFSIKIQKRP